MIRGFNMSLCVLAFDRFVAFEKADHILAKPFAHFILRTVDSTVAIGSILRFKPDGPRVNNF